MSNPIFEASAVDAGAPLILPAGATGRRRHSALGLSIELHGPEIPRAILAAAEQSADNPYSCLAVCRAFEPAIAAVLRHAVVSSETHVLGILSYYERKSTLVVVNRLMEFDTEVLQDCASTLFAAHPTARRITIDGVYASATRRRRVPCRAWSAIENLLVALPPSFEQYMSHFGSKTRKNLRYCAKRFERENPEARLSVLRGGEIDTATVHDLVKLNHLRMQSKGRVSGMDTQFADGLSALSASHGVACVARDKDGTILGGALCTHVGNGFALQVIAHDPRFNHVRLGLLCLLRSIETAIDTGATVFHFLWGESDYKALFGARAAPLWSYRYYRSWPYQFLALSDWRDSLMQLAKRYAKTLRAASRQRSLAKTQ